jgi:nitrate/nitrite-specific signal transduction histidine kinase
VVCFQPFKYYYGEAIDAAVRIKDTQFLKIDFLAVFKIFYQETFKPSIVILVFRKSGIILYNLAKVLRPLQEKNEAAERAHRRELAHEIMTSEEEDLQFNNPLIPITAEELWSVGEHLLNKFKIGDLSPRLRT